MSTSPEDVDQQARNTWDHCIAPESLFLGNSLGLKKGLTHLSLQDNGWMRKGKQGHQQVHVSRSEKY